MRGISPVVATLILVAITAIAGIIATVYNGADAYAKISDISLYGSGFPDYTAEVKLAPNTSVYIDQFGIVGFYDGWLLGEYDEVPECYIYVDEEPLLGWYDCFGNMTNGSMNVTFESVTGWLGQVGAYLHVLGGVQYDTLPTSPYLTVLKSGTPLWTLETEQEAYGWVSGADEVMMACAIYGDVDLTYVGEETNTIGIRFLDTDVEPDQIVPVMPRIWTLRDDFGNVVFSGNYANATYLFQSVFFNTPLVPENEKDNCLLMANLTGTLEVDPGFGVPQTKQISPGQRVTFGWVKIDNTYYVDNNLDGVPDNTGTIHAVVTSDIPSGNATTRGGMYPVVEAPVKAYKTGGCAAAYLPDSVALVDSGCVPDYSCTTDSYGECDMYVEPDSYHVLVQLMDKAGRYPGHNVGMVDAGQTRIARLAFKADESWIWIVGGILALLLVFLFCARRGA